jgi:hypothetical protein
MQAAALVRIATTTPPITSTLIPRLQISLIGFNGNNGDVLTSDGTFASWKPPSGAMVLNSSITGVPGGGAWVATTGTVPYGGNGAGYTGTNNITSSATSFFSWNGGTNSFQVQQNCFVRVTVMQTIEVGDALGLIESNGRLQFLGNGVQQGTDSGRFQTTAGMFAAGMLAYTMGFDIYVQLLTGVTYTVNATNEGPPGGGLLISKGSMNVQVVQLT